MPNWTSNAYLRRLHRLALQTQLICVGSILAIILGGMWLDDTVVWIILAALAVWALVYMVKFAPACFDPRLHPSFRDLGAYGDPEAVAQALSIEMARGGQKVQGVLLGHEWILIPSITRWDGVRPADVMWMYPKVTTTRYYGVIPVNREHEAIILTRRREFAVKGKQRRVQELLEALSGKAPWAPVGYNEQLQEMFNGQRAAAFDHVDARRRSMVVGG